MNKVISPQQLMVQKLVEKEMKNNIKQPSETEIRKFYDNVRAKMKGENLGLPKEEEETVDAVAKAVAFVFLIFAAIPALEPYFAAVMALIGTYAAAIALVLCVLRGLPVIYESKRFFVKEENK